MSCQDDEPDAGARQLLGGKPGPKPPPKSRAGGGTSPLHLASCRGHVGVVHELLIAGADATRGDQFGYSALHLAAKHGFPDVITELLSFSSVDVDLLDENGETALHTAARYAKTVCMSRLLERGGNLNILSRSGRRAMDVVGQPQDKHNLQSLPHSATQLAGTGVSRRSPKFNTNMPPAQLPRDKCTEERIRRLLTVAASGKKSGWMWPEGVLLDPSDIPPPPPPPADAAAAAAAAADEDDDDTWDPVPEDSSDSDTDTDTAEGAADDAAGAHATTRARGSGETAAGSAPNAHSPKRIAQGKNGLGGAPGLADKTPHAVAENASSAAGGGGGAATSPAATAVEVAVSETTGRAVRPPAEEGSAPVVVRSSNSRGAADLVVPAAAASSSAAGDAAGADAAAGGAASATTAATVAGGDVGGNVKVPAANGDVERGSANGGVEEPVGGGGGGMKGPAVNGDGGSGSLGSGGEIGAAGGAAGAVVDDGLCGRVVASSTGNGVGGLEGAVSKALPSPLARLNVRRLIRTGGEKGNADVFKAINR